MRFGAFIPQGWTLDLADVPVEAQWGVAQGVARALEQAGFESGWLYDHFHTVPEPTQESTFEAWSTTAALAAATTTLRLGQMCTCNSYRPPALLAHMAATIDVISGGRVDMAIGAGWYAEEYLAHGYDFPSPSVRIGQLAEAVELMRLMWTEDRAFFEGEYYRLDGAICRPKPIQRPHIPIWVAGGGEQLTLRVAARSATYTNFGGSLDQFVHKSEVLAGHCRNEGTDFDAITRSMNLTMVCAPTEAEANERLDELLGRMRPLVADTARLERRFLAARDLSGPPDKIVERLGPYVAAGVGYLIVRFPEAAYDQAGIELFGREVIGNL